MQKPMLSGRWHRLRPPSVEAGQLKMQEWKMWEQIAEVEMQE